MVHFNEKNGHVANQKQLKIYLFTYNGRVKDLAVKSVRDPTWRSIRRFQTLDMYPNQKIPYTKVYLSSARSTLFLQDSSYWNPY